MRLKGQVAVVTGGSQGIGEALAKRYAAEGAKVAILNRNEAKAESVVREIQSSGGDAAAFRTDISRITDIDRAIAGVVKRYGTINLLVNNAAAYLMSPLGATTEEAVDTMLSTNIKGVFFLSQSVLPVFERNGRGKIINIGSIFGNDGFPGSAIYCATKGAIVALTKQLAVDYPMDFRVNCICPGTVETPFVEGYLEKYHKHEKEKVRAELKQRQPIGRLGRPEEVADLAVYLASDEAGFMNGAALPIDGGWTAA